MAYQQPQQPQQSWISGIGNSFSNMFGQKKEQPPSGVRINSPQIGENVSSPPYSAPSSSYSASSSSYGGKRGKKKGKHSKKSMKGGYPKKGMASRTRRGRKDFITHKGDKMYNRKGHRQRTNKKGRKGRPYSRRR